MKRLPPTEWDYQFVKLLRRALITNKIQPHFVCNRPDFYFSRDLTSAINSIGRNYYLPPTGPNALYPTALRLELVCPTDRIQLKSNQDLRTGIYIHFVPNLLSKWLSSHKPSPGQPPISDVHPARREAVIKLSKHLTNRGYTPDEVRQAYWSVFKELLN